MSRLRNLPLLILALVTIALLGFPLSAGAVTSGPLAVDDTMTVGAGGLLNVSASVGVLSNDQDPLAAGLTASILTAPEHASQFTLNPDGSYLYAPSVPFTGDDSFTYTASDAAGDSSTATVTISVTRVAPVAVSDRVFDRLQRLTCPDPAQVSSFGSSIAASGDTAVVGASGFDSGAGAVFIYGRVGGVWEMQQKLTPLTPQGGASFGEAVAIDGNTLVVGSPHESVAGTTSGGAYVFSLVDGVWTQQQQLVPSDGEVDDHFGYSVAISGDTVVVGSPLGGGTVSSSGSAYVYTKSDGSWQQQQEISASDAAASDNFGYSVGVTTDTVLVTAPNRLSSGAAYTFELKDGQWRQAQLLSSGTGHQFGRSLAVSGSTLVVGSAHDGSNGAAYVYSRNESSWAFQQELVSHDTGQGDRFGLAVAVSDDTILVGAPLDTANYFINAGSAFLYKWSGTRWAECRRITAPESTNFAHFGLNLALADGNALIGSPGEGQDHGAVHVYQTDLYVTDEDTPVTISSDLGILANDFDPDGDRFTPYLVDTSSLHGTLVLNADGSFTYTPEHHFSGVATCTYRTFDGSFTSNIGAISITVPRVNEPPVAKDDFVTVHTDEFLSSPMVTSNDFDPDSDWLTAVGTIAGPSHAKLFTLWPNGIFYYRSTPSYVGLDSFTYVVSDGHGGSSMATVTINVIPWPSPPPPPPPPPPVRSPLPVVVSGGGTVIKSSIATATIVVPQGKSVGVAYESNGVLSQGEILSSGTSTYVFTPESTGRVRAFFGGDGDYAATTSYSETYTVVPPSLPVRIHGGDVTVSRGTAQTAIVTLSATATVNVGYRTATGAIEQVRAFTRGVHSYTFTANKTGQVVVFFPGDDEFGETTVASGNYLVAPLVSRSRLSATTTRIDKSVSALATISPAGCDHALLSFSAYRFAKAGDDTWSWVLSKTCSASVDATLPGDVLRIRANLRLPNTGLWRVRASWAGDESLIATEGAHATIGVSPAIGRTSAPAYAATRRNFTVTSSISPGVGSSALVRFRAYHRERQRNGSYKWVLRKTITPSISSTAASTSKLTARTSLPSKGGWRIYTYYRGESYVPAASGPYDTVVVK